MTYQIRAFLISFLLHSMIFTAVIFISTFIGQSKKVVAMDFNLCKPKTSVKKVELPVPAPIINIKTIKPKVRQPSKGGKKSVQKKEEPQTSPYPEIPPIVELPKADSPENHETGLGVPDSITVTEGSAGIAGGTKEGSGTGSGGEGSEGGGKSAKTKYLEDQFAYIRDKILKNITYPDVAKRMGWQGKVLLTFIITADGFVRELKIIESSGFPLLDKIAMETVKDTAPFPKPPGEVQLVMPITYRLE